MLFAETSINGADNTQVPSQENNLSIKKLICKGSMVKFNR